MLEVPATWKPTDDDGTGMGMREWDPYGKDAYVYVGPPMELNLAPWQKGNSGEQQPDLDSNSYSDAFGVKFLGAVMAATWQLSLIYFSS